MKKLSTLFLAAALTLSMVAQDAAKKIASAAPVIPAAKAVLAKPMVLKDGAISQPQQTELADGGKAVFEFTVAEAGTFEIYAEVNANAEDANSFYLNIDAPPEDPMMIWDIDVTSGFEERVVSWRGKGDADNDEFKPKRFTLNAGAHKLYLVGREAPTELRSFSVRPVAK